MKLDAKVRSRAIRVTATAAAFTGLFVPARALAADIRWQAPPDCDAREHVAEQVEKLLERQLATIDTVDFEVTVERRDSAWHVRVSGVERRGGEKRTRELSSASCAEAAEAAAVAISMAVRSTDSIPTGESASPPVETSRASTEPAAPEPDAVIPDRPVRRSENRSARPPARSRFGGAVGAFALLDRGTLPNLSPGLAIEASLARTLFRITAFGGVLAAQTQEVPRGGGGEFQLVFGGARACVEQPEGRLRPFGCVGLEVGRLSGQGVGVPVSHSGGALWLAGDVDVGLSVPLSDAFAFSARVGALLPLRRPEFALGGTEIVFRPASFVGRGGLGFELIW